VLND